MSTLQLFPCKVYDEQISCAPKYGGGKGSEAKDTAFFAGDPDELEHGVSRVMRCLGGDARLASRGLDLVLLCDLVAVVVVEREDVDDDDDGQGLFRLWCITSS